MRLDAASNTEKKKVTVILSLSQIGLRVSLHERRKECD